MQQFGGKNTKRHFTVVMNNKEHGLYVSSTPSSAAKKAVTKLCASNKGKEVEFYIREITQGSKKKTYGPYLGQVEKLKEPIKLKGRIIQYKSVAKLSKKTDKKMRGGGGEPNEDNIGNQPITNEELKQKVNKLKSNTQQLKSNFKKRYSEIIFNKKLNEESQNLSNTAKKNNSKQSNQINTPSSVPPPPPPPPPPPIVSAGPQQPAALSANSKKTLDLKGKEALLANLKKNNPQARLKKVAQAVPAAASGPPGISNKAAANRFAILTRAHQGLNNTNTNNSNW
jgi:arsenate reductase-like glutaredoxin family protein